MRYELGKPRYSMDECRQLRLTYGRPFRIWLRLNKDQPVEEEVYLGDLPIMLGGGEFIINGAGARRRCASSTGRRASTSSSEMDPGERSHVLVPRDSRAAAAGSSSNTTKKDSVHRPHRPERQVLGDDAAAGDVARSWAPTPRFLRAFYPVTKQKVVDGRSGGKLEGKVAVEDIVYPGESDRAGEIIIEVGAARSPKNVAEIIVHVRREAGRRDGPRRRRRIC